MLGSSAFMSIGFLSCQLIQEFVVVSLLFASSVKCVDVHHYACIKVVIMYLCSDPNNVL